MASSSPSGVIARARTFPGLAAILFGGIGGIFLTFFEQIIAFIQALTNLGILPLATLANQVAANVRAFVGGGARIIAAGVTTTVTSILPGGRFALGPFTFAESIAAVGAGLVTMAVILSLAPTSNLIPFTFTDFPFVGVNEDEENFPDEG